MSEAKRNALDERNSAALLATVLGPALVTLLAVATDNALIAGLVYVLAIMAASSAGGVKYGLAAAVLSLVPFVVFFTPPGEMGFEATEDVIAAVVFAATAIAAGVLFDRQRKALQALNEERSRARSAQRRAEVAAATAHRLQLSAEALSSAVTPDQVLDAVLTQSVAAAEARAGLIALLTEDGSELEILAQRGYTHQRLRDWQRFPLDADYPLSYAVRTGEGVFIGSAAERLERFPALGEINEPTHALVCLPLVVEGRTIGGLTFSFAKDQVFDEDRRALKVALARQAAQALERARLFGALSEAERRMSYLAEASRVLAYVGDGVFLVDRVSIVRYWNRAASLIVGVDAHDAVGRPAADVVPGWALIEEHVRPVEATSAELGRAAAIPVTVDDEERWLSIVAVELGDGRVYAMRDVTVEHALEQARSDFVATASHELRTPLAAVYGAVKTLRREDLQLDGSVANAFLDMIEHETERLSTIVNQILLAGQLESGRVSLVERECDLRELVEGVLSAARVTAPESVEFEVEAANGLQLQCDEDKLRQVLVNLVENAVKYSPDGGTVTVSVSAENGRARIEVRDHGLGIPESDHARVFEKFTRLDPGLSRGVGGTGLGLYIARELVERMGGEIAVVSALGSGSTFAVELPTT
ncbi:MAG TPA: ATP-binding protein [Gaiellaceae bacterium]|jgi:signal transduction histidine kinase